MSKQIKIKSCYVLSVQDDSSFVQGPFSSLTMLEWQRAGYFRSGLLLRREVRSDFIETLD